MTDARAARAIDLRLLNAAAIGQLADRYRARGGWRAVLTMGANHAAAPGTQADTGRTSAAHTRGDTWQARAGQQPVSWRAIKVDRQVRRLLAAGLLLPTPGPGGYEPRPFVVTTAGYAVLDAHRSRDLRRWWMSGTADHNDVSFFPTRTARQALTRHRAVRRSDPVRVAGSRPRHAAASVRTLDGPLTTGEMLHRAAELDAGWAHAWALAARRGLGEVPIAPLDQARARLLLPVDALADIGANITARHHQRLAFLSVGLVPPDVLPSSRHSWHAWIGTAAATVHPTDPGGSPVHHESLPIPGLCPIFQAPPPQHVPPTAPAAARAFPPLRRGEDGPATLHASGPITAPAANPTHTRPGPRR